jgi:hypothetical protein
MARQANWYFKLKPAERAKQLEYLERTIKDLRQYFAGFDAKAGYDLRFIRSLHPNRVKTIQQYGSYLHNLQSVGHVRVIPRSKRARKAMRDFTGQRLPRQKAYVFHTPHPEITKVTAPGGNVKIERTVAAGKIREQFFLFEQMLGYQPVTFDDMRAALKEMLAHMPPGYYQLWTVPHGEIGAPARKEMIATLLRDYEQRYEQGPRARLHKDFAEAILGFKWQGNTFEDAADAYNERQAARARRRKQKRFEQRARAAKRRRRR